MAVFISQHFLTLVLLLSCINYDAHSAPQTSQKEESSQITPLNEQEIPTEFELKNRIHKNNLSTGLQYFTGTFKEEGQSISGLGLTLNYIHRLNYSQSLQFSFNLINQQNIFINISHQSYCCFHWGENYFWSIGIGDNLVPSETLNNLLQLKRYKLTASFGKNDFYFKNFDTEFQIGWGLIGFIYQFNFTYRFPINSMK